MNRGFMAFIEKLNPIHLGLKILVVTASHTGNNIFCTPAVHFIKKHNPNAIIDVVTLNLRSAEVFEGNPDIDNVHVVKSSWAFNRLVKNYSLVICLNNKSTRILSRMHMQVVTVPELNAEVHHAEQILQFIAQLFNKEVSDSDRQYVIGQSVGLRLSVIDDIHVNDEDIIVNMHLGCGRIATHGWKFFNKGRYFHRKVWPIEEYIKLGHALLKANPRIRISITGTKHEAVLSNQFEKEVPGTINLVGETSIQDVYQWFSKIDLSISHDCGIFHIAVASNVPTIGLFGATNVNLTGPYPLKKQHTIIKKESMTQISVSEVLVAAHDLMKDFPKKHPNKNTLAA